MSAPGSRVVLLRPIAMLVVAVAVIGLSACGDDGDGDSTVSESTTSGPASEQGSTSSTDASEPGDSQVRLTLGGEERTLTVESCRSDTGTSLELVANDADGNTLTLQASGGSGRADGTGSVAYRGASEDREGKVRTVTVQADGTFDVTGLLSVADDSATITDEMRLTGSCAD